MAGGGVHPLGASRARSKLTAVLLGTARGLSAAVNVEKRVLPAVRRVPGLGRLGGFGRWLRVHMTDEWWIAALAAALSIGAFVWYDAHSLTTAFNDAQYRELIARRVVASRTPGLAQLGYTWLPLPSILMLPLIWNDALFRDGIAGSLPSMLGFIVAAVYTYRIGRLVTSSRGAGWVAAAVVTLNPSLLYMQGTAMSETPSLSAFVVSVYYALRLTHTYEAPDLVKCAAAVAAGTLIRYENWVLALVLLPILAYVGWRHRGAALAEAWAVLYGLLAFAGCAIWVLYNAVIFRDPLLSFFYGQSSHTYYANVPDSVLPARHHPLVALAMYGYTVAATVGWALAGLALLGLIVFIWRTRLQRSLLPVYLTLVPIGFYWLVLYVGANTELLPEFGAGVYYNIRFGLLMIPAVALFLSFLTMGVPVFLRRALVGVALAVITVSSILGSTMQTPFVLREALYGAAGLTKQPLFQAEARWFSLHYHGGSVLITYINNPSMIFFLLTEYQFSDRVFVTDANGSQFDRALKHPETSVRWIVLNSDDSGGTESLIWTTLHNRQEWRHHFALRETFGTTEIYESV
jgi:Dolichyl-phosphate-mannose-protein mannosyltransferase